MGRASSSKKVARAARAGGKGAKVGRERSLLFPVSLAAVIILGLLLVVYARSTIDPAEAVAPGVNDHWHQAYGLYACDEFLAPLSNDADPNGITARDDGAIHIHPGQAETSPRTGDSATLGVALSSSGANLGDNRIDLPQDEYDPASYVEGEDTCGDEEAIVQVAYWFSAANTDEDPEIFTDGLADIDFDGDGGAYTIAFAPDGADIPPPESAPDLPEISTADGGPSHPNAAPTATTASPATPAVPTTTP